MYYTYKHIRLDTNEVFYVGIGIKYEGNTDFQKYTRAYQTFSRNKFWKSIVRKVEYEIEILNEFEEKIDCEKDEIRLIKLYGRRDLNQGTLVNLTDGGEGLKGNKAYNRQQVHQYSLEGHYIASFDSITEAERALKCNNISACCRGVINTAGKFQWSYDKKDKVTSVKYHTSKSRSKIVQQLNNEGGLIAEFDSINEASRQFSGGRSGVSSISQCCNGKREKYKNFIWKFKNE